VRFRWWRRRPRSPYEPRALPGVKMMTLGGRPPYPEVGAKLNPDARVPDDAGAAAWLHDRLLPWREGVYVGSTVPTGYDAYARVLHPPRDAERRPVRWADVARWSDAVVHAQMQWEAISRPLVARAGPPPFARKPVRGFCPPHVQGPLAERLAEHTTTPDSYWACIWVGYGGFAEAFPGAPRVRLPGREYILVSATLEAISGGVLIDLGGFSLGPNIWWPEDRASCVSTEIDFCWT
jgi:hypothetical protein